MRAVTRFLSAPALRPHDSRSERNAVYAVEAERRRAPTERRSPDTVELNLAADMTKPVGVGWQ